MSKSLMAPAVPKRGETERQSPPGEPAATQAPAAAPKPAANSAAYAGRAIEEKLRALRAHIEATADGVGKDFAKEARAIHDGEAEERPIYGEATREEVEDLMEDDIPVAPIPWVNRHDD